MYPVMLEIATPEPPGTISRELLRGRRLQDELHTEQIDAKIAVGRACAGQNPAVWSTCRGLLWLHASSPVHATTM